MRVSRVPATNLRNSDIVATSPESLKMTAVTLEDLEEVTNTQGAALVPASA